MPPGKRTVVFLHPDLGIGGAERLIIDAALGLQELGYKVVIYTSHCDPAHCFDEARDGTLDVRTHESFVPPHFFGQLSILCAILRQIHLVLYITIFSNQLSSLKPTAFIVDQLSAGIPLLTLFYPASPTLFYCHFPDKLLASRKSWLKRIYRLPFDTAEEWSTGWAARIVVNSKFTEKIVRDVFPSLSKKEINIVYPCVDIAPASKDDEEQDSLWKDKKILLSINRFERKKNIELALRAFAGLSAKEREGVRLVIAGGYDRRVPENVSYHLELATLADSLSLSHSTASTLPTALSIPASTSVLFLLNCPSKLKSLLLRSALLLLYTPANEHFGIVPLEAMLARTPVLAVNSGGPLETVVEGRTGFLRGDHDDTEWTAVILDFLAMPDEELRQVGENGRKRVEQLFSREKMATTLEKEVKGMVEEWDGRERKRDAVVWLGVLGVFVVVGVSWIGKILMYRYKFPEAY